MPNFTVDLEATLTHTYQMEVEADDAEAAKDQAIYNAPVGFCVECSDFGWSSIDWEPVEARPTVDGNKDSPISKTGEREAKPCDTGVCGSTANGPRRTVGVEG